MLCVTLECGKEKEKSSSSSSSNAAAAAVVTEKENIEIFVRSFVVCLRLDLCVCRHDDTFVLFFFTRSDIDGGGCAYNRRRQQIQAAARRRNERETETENKNRRTKRSDIQTDIYSSNGCVCVSVTSFVCICVWMACNSLLSLEVLMCECVFAFVCM